VVARNVGYRDSYCEDVGGDALNWRVDGWVKRAGPFGEDSLNFATATKAFIAQVFDTGANTGGTGTTVSDVVVFLRKVGGGTPSDVVEVAIETTTGSPSEPTGTAVSGLDFSDFETYDATVLGNGFTAVRFRRTSASPTRLTENTDYALVVKHDDTTDAVAVQYDSNSGTDTYTDGDAWVSQTGASSSWTQQSNQDLNFFIANGSIEAPFIKNVHIKDGDGSCANLRATFSGNLSGLTCENTQAVKVGEADMMLNSVVNGFSVTNTNGSTESSAGFRVGSYWLGGTISNGSADGTPDGAPCLFLVAWSRDATFQMMNLSNCGDEGVESKGGTRRIVMNDVNISGADADAYLFTTNADSDGVDGGDHDWLISGGIVRGVNDSGIFAGGGVQLERLTVQGVSFQNVGKYCFEGEISTGSINRMRLLNNTFKGWGEDGTGQQLRCVELDGTWNDVDIIGNTFESLGNNESHGIVYDMAAGDDLLVMGNRCHGTFSSDCFIGIQTASREYIFIGNDWNGQAWNDAASPALLKIRSDGTIAFGDSNVDRPDVRLFRHAADIVGVDSGDCLAIGGSGATQATWCQSDSAPSGGCSPDGSLFSDTAGADSGLYVCENGTWSAKK
jgi:hypothetical protein